tara:strand:- start:490 stop:786 length:297 start_codon:yes stop_codon:yes gene_type:complete
MSIPNSFCFNDFEVSNFLWPIFVEQIGILKANQAVNQCLDLQLMSGNSHTIPVLILDTCGIALINSIYLTELSGIKKFSKETVFIVNNKEKKMQIINR